MTAGQQAARQYRMEQWTKIITERAHSGQSVIEWCVENGVSQRVYYYRLGQVRKYAAEAMAVAGAGVTGTELAEGRGAFQSQISCATRLSAPGFAEVKLIESSTQPTISGTPPDQLHIEIGEMRITAGSAYPPEKLAALLRKLTQLC